MQNAKKETHCIAQNVHFASVLIWLLL